jgi:hypothetical protein
MRRVLAWIATIAVGLALGAGSAWWALQAGHGAFMQHLGQWSWSRTTGSIDAGPYTRAVIARDALLALSADEAIYLNLDRDENGQPLREDCVYELSGGAIPARWWSITLYAPDNYLAQNNDAAYSIDSTHIGGDGQWTARIAPVRGEAAHWISSRAARRGYSLTLRAYNADEGFPGDASALPALRTVSCPDTPS